MKGHEMKTWTLVAALAAAAVVLALPASAQQPAPTTQPAAAPPPAASHAESPIDGAPAETDRTAEDWITASKNPVPWLKWGADARLRDEWLDNNTTLNERANGHEAHQQRYRGRIWSTVTPIEGVDINSRLLYEPRHNCKPDSAETWVFNEALFDQLNVKLTKPAGMPATWTLGRQDIILGDGWLVLDGTPLDGGRTIFFDAIRGTWELADINTKVDTIYIEQKGQESGYIKPFGDEELNIAEDDSNGAIVYVSNKSLPKTQIDGYYIFKHDNMTNALGRGFPAAWQQDADINTFGARIAGDITDNWKYRSEVAQQVGRKQRFGQEIREICAFGTNNRLEYHLLDEWKNNFRVGYEFLSGDDGDGRDNEFDPLWGRWPQFSEIIVRTYAAETRIAHVTNLHRLGFGHTFTPIKDVEVCTDYHLLFADENNRAASPRFSDSGGFRGQLATFLVRYKMNPHVSMHWLAETFCPGNYFEDNDSPGEHDSAGDMAMFLRYEVVFSW